MGFSNLKLVNLKHKNYDNLLDFIYYSTLMKWDTFINKKQIILFFFTDDIKKRCTIRLCEESSVKQTGQNSWLIKIKERDNKERMLSSLIHEVTHISQKYNGLYKYEFSKQWKQYKEIKENNKRLNYTHYYNEVGHQNMITEKEAKLMQVYFYLKNHNYDKAVHLILFEKEYFDFLYYKEFIKKGYIFGIKDSDIFKRFNTEIAKEVNRKLKLYIEHYKENKNPNLVGYYFEFLKEILPISSMFNISFLHHNKWLYNILNSDKEYLKQSHMWNWDYMIEVSQELNH